VHGSYSACIDLEIKSPISEGHAVIKCAASVGICRLIALLRFLVNLARSAKLPEGLYILPMFFLYFLFFFIFL